MPSLPFLKLGQLRQQDNAVVADNVPISVWPADGRNSPDGRVFDHEGECPLSFLAQVSAPNRHFIIDGVRYQIVQATAHDFVPHVALGLRVSSGG